MSLISLTKDDYQQACSRLGEFLKEQPGFKSFGQFGEVRSPGISDLDLLVLVRKDRWSELNLSIQNFLVQDEVLAYCCTHDVLLFSYEDRKLLPILHTLYGFKNILGEPGISFDENRERSRLLELFWCYFLYPIGLQFLWYGQDLRSGLLLQKNLWQGISNLKKIRGDEDAEDCLTIVQSLRDRALRGEGVFEELKESIRLALQIMPGLACHSAREFGISSTGSFPVNESFLIQGNGESWSSSKSGGFFHLDVDEWTLGILRTLKEGNAKNEVLEQYRLASSEAYQLCRSHGVPFPFILPFGSLFFRADVKQKLKESFALFRDFWG